MFCFTFVSDHYTDYIIMYSVQLKNMYSYLNSSLKLSDIVRGLSCQQSYCNLLSLYKLIIIILVGHPEPEKKILLAFLSTFWHPCSKCILMCFKKDRGGCQVWKCPKVPELGQRSTKCKLLNIRQILAFSSLSYPKL